jgi:hypothetical protein
MRARTALVATGGILGGLFAGVAAGELTLSGHALAVAALLWLAIPFICWRRPASGVLLLVASALVIEEYPSIPGMKIITESIPLFKSLSVGVGLTGVAVNPAEILIATVAATWVLKAVAEGNMALPRSHLAVGVGLLLVAVIAGEAHGLATGSNVVASLWEVRPWAYLACAYVLAAQLIKTRRLVWAVLWTMVIASGLKGLEGTIRWLVSLRVLTKPAEQILGHEESVFLGLFILLTAALWLLRVKGRMRQVATALLPFVVFTNLANNRRTAYVILGAGIAILIAVAWAREPRQRWMTGGIAVALLAAMTLYLPVFWNRTGLPAAPAIAIRSAVDPNQRNAASDLYRVLENTDLGIDIRASTPFGIGFGKPIPTPIALTDVTNIDSFIVYEPHNTILYIWLRMGFPGAIAFWWMIGAAIVAACGLARVRDTQLPLVGTFALLAMSSYLIEGWYDQGLVSLRVAIFIGAVLGTMEAARRLVPARPAS